MKGEIAVRYTIRHFDLPLLTFEANMDSADTGLHFIKVYEENRSFLPLNLTVSEDGVERWLRHRAIPKNRAYVDALLSKVGLSLNRPLGIIAANKGLSLNDCFWVDAEGSGDTFEKVNLYDNRFSQVLAVIAFTGYGSSIRTSLASCPEFSTNGMLPKCWRRQNGKIYLYKGGTSGFSNFGFEPYSELYAYQVAQVMGVNAIRYTLTKDLKRTLCSKCELFTSKEYSYIPIGQLVSKGGIKAILAYLEKYKDINFGQDGSYYVIPKDQYEQIKKVLSGDTDGLSAKSIRAIKEKIREIEEQTGRSFFDVVRSGNVDYAAVQRGKIMETLDKKSDQLNQTADNQKQRADERSDKKREQAQQEAAPSLQKAGKAAAEAAFISGGFQLAVGIYSKCKEGKKINEFTVDDWKDIGIDTAKAAAEGGISGFAIYSITNFTSISAGPAAAGVSLAFSVSELAYRKSTGAISDEEFKESCQMAALNAAVSAVGAAIGQELIPIPLLGAWIGSFIATQGLERLCDEGFHNALTMSAYEVRKMTQRLEYGTARIAYSSAYTNQAISQAQNLHEETQTLLDDFNRKKR